MKKELEQTLIKAYPNLYAEYKHGFAVGDGWFLLIENLSKKLEALILELPETRRSDFRITQIKEKFGMLRCYMFLCTPEMDKIIQEAEAQSTKTCERCGRPGEIKENNYWLKCQCDVCMLLK